jgi:hypothetical protein
VKVLEDTAAVIDDMRLRQGMCNSVFTGLMHEWAPFVQHVVGRLGQVQEKPDSRDALGNLHQALLKREDAGPSVIQGLRMMAHYFECMAVSRPECI